MVSALDERTCGKISASSQQAAAADKKAVEHRAALAAKYGLPSADTAADTAPKAAPREVLTAHKASADAKLGIVLESKDGKLAAALRVPKLLSQDDIALLLG